MLFQRLSCIRASSSQSNSIRRGRKKRGNGGLINSLRKRAYHASGSVMKDYYEILGVPKDADKKTLKKAYHKLAMQYHPDRNKEPGADEKFKEISNAYSVLSNDQKRQTYDQFGEEGVNAGFGAQGFNPEDIFAEVFGQGFSDLGGGFGFGQKQRTRKPTRTEDLVHEMSLPLEDFYNGATRMLEYPREEICNTCDGRGTNALGIDKTCTRCKGTGQEKKIQRFGGGMFQSIAECGTCGGTGEHVHQKDACGSCHGKGTKRTKKVIKIEIPPGTKDGKDFIFYGDANQYPGASAGDVIISVVEKPHHLFTRSGDDLYMKQSISLVEALTGYEFSFNHLDGRKINVKLEPNSNIISPNEVHVIEEEGMPGQFKKGNLYVQFAIDFPKGKLLDQNVLLSELGRKQSVQTQGIQVEARKTNKQFVTGGSNQEAGNYQKYKKKRTKQNQEQQNCVQM